MVTRYGVAVALAVLAITPDAMANGRFPLTNAIFFAPNEPDVILLRTTFGLVMSRDRAKTWSWICERSIGLAGVEDPMYSVTPNGTIIATSFQGLSVSRDRACNWSFVSGELKGLVFIDLTARPSTPGNVVAFASSYAGQASDSAILFGSKLFETKNEGVTFTSLGASFDATLLGETVDVAPSDPDRIYVSAIRNPGATLSAVLLTSRDHGKLFEESPVPLIGPERAAFIAGVDPVDADRIYVRTAGGDAPSRLLVSDDAGKSFRAVFTGAGPLAGFALSADGKRLYVGGPRDGVNVASTTDFAFQQKSKIEVGCLALSGDGLWACSTERSGFIAGLSTDEGGTWQAKLRFCEIRGPRACPTGSSTNTECTLGGTSSNATPPWPPQRASLGCSSIGPDSGADGGPVGDAAADPVSVLDAGGGCSFGAASPAPFAALLAGVLSTIALLRRRGRRRG